MSEAIVHIGLPKTGSTTLQRFLAVNADRLVKQGIHYPDGFVNDSHLELAVASVPPDDEASLRMRGVVGAEEQRAFRARLRERLIPSDEHTWVFTSEHLASRLADDASVARLADLLSSFSSVKVVMFVRRQDEMMAGSHSTWLRDGSSDRFDLSLHLDFPSRYDFEEIARRWERTFGPRSLTVLLWSADRVVDDFAHALGLEDVDEWERPPSRNLSLSAPAAGALRRLNEVWAHEAIDPAERARRIARLIERCPGPPLRLSSADSELVLTRYADSNAETLSRVADPKPPDYFDVRSDGDHPGTMEVEPDVDLDELARDVAVRPAAPSAG